MERAAVASGHQLVSEAAAEVLRSGGNAFDAAIAAGFAASVAEPALTSLGGGGFLLARTNKGACTLFDFFSDSPGLGLSEKREQRFVPVTVPFGSANQLFQAGLGSCAVPGCLRGYLHVHERLGRLDLASLVAPTVRAARQGVTLNASNAYVHKILGPILTLTPAAREIFAPRGELLGEGDTLRNEALAELLERIPGSGDGVLYDGEVASQIERDMAAGGGLLTAADLKAYRVIEREPLEIDYRGRRLLTNPAPSLGGPLIGLSLELMRGINLERVTHGSAEHLSALVGVMREVDRLRETESPFARDPVEMAEAARSLRRFTRGTTHVSVIDGDGNCASMTTSNGEGCGYVAPGTGIMLNNMLGEDDLHPGGVHESDAGARIASMMSPTIVTESDEVRLVLGSGGSKRIRTAVMRVMSDTIDFGLPLADAIASPRIHWDGECAQAEPGLAPEALAAIESKCTVNRWDAKNVYFGGVHGVTGDGDAAADARRHGAAITIPLSP